MGWWWACRRSRSDGSAPAAARSTRPSAVRCAEPSMRERWVLSAASAAVLACSSVSAVREPAVEYEIAYDDNRPADTTALVTSTFEQMVRFRPSAKSFHLLRFRALLAQEGRV